MRLHGDCRLKRSVISSWLTLLVKSGERSRWKMSIKSIIRIWSRLWVLKVVILWLPNHCQVYNFWHGKLAWVFPSLKSVLKRFMDCRLMSIIWTGNWKLSKPSFFKTNGQYRRLPLNWDTQVRQTLIKYSRKDSWWALRQCWNWFTINNSILFPFYNTHFYLLT